MINNKIVEGSDDGSGLLGSWTSSIVWYSNKLENMTFRKLDLFLTSCEEEDIYSVEALRKS
jgi:hypothetical protein